MSVYLYDESLIARLRSLMSQILDDERPSIIPSEKAFTKSGHVDDEVALPFISVWRDQVQLISMNRTITGYRQGKQMQLDEDDIITAFQYIPIRISYQLDVVTRTRQQNDELWRELVWYFTLYPNQSIEVEWEIDSVPQSQTIKYNVFLGEDIVDNSELMEFEERGQYYRSTLNLIVDEAQLFFLRYDIPKTLTIQLQAIDNDGGEI